MCRPVPVQSSSLYSSVSLDIDSVYVGVLFNKETISTPTMSPVSTADERTKNMFRTLGEKTKANAGGGIGRNESIGAKEGSELGPIGRTALDTEPVAHAGDDVLVVLPRTTAWLYGNQSTDDKVRIVRLNSCC